MKTSVMLGDSRCLYKTLYITRFKTINDGTIGEFKLMQDNKVLLSGYTLEPAGPDTTTPNQDKRIPSGAYTATWSFSPSFNAWLPLLSNQVVSKNRRILIHAGNHPKDTLGCILLGTNYDQNGIYRSKDKLKEFIELTKGSDFEVRIINSKDVL